MQRSRVVLRPLGEADVDHIMTWVNDADIVGNIASFSGEPFTREQEVEYVRNVMKSEQDRVFSVFCADDNRYLGQVGLHQIHERSRVGRLACIIGSRHSMGKGYGTAAIASILDIAFDSERLHKVWLMIFESNERAHRTYQRIGFIEEGILREEYFHEGLWRNMRRMSLLATEWNAARE